MEKIALTSISMGRIVNFMTAFDDLPDDVKGDVFFDVTYDGRDPSTIKLEVSSYVGDSFNQALQLIAKHICHV